MITLTLSMPELELLIQKSLELGVDLNRGNINRYELTNPRNTGNLAYYIRMSEDGHNDIEDSLASKLEWFNSQPHK